MQKNLLITGSNGQLGSEIRVLAKNYPNFNFFFTDKEELDITDKIALENYIQENNIHILINCAAYTAVDKAESEPGLADKINHLATQYMAAIAKKYAIRLIHISTDYVFDGKGHQPYPVDYPTNPINQYGATKLKGEEALKSSNPDNALLIRTAWVYSSFGHNFVKTMLRLGAEKEELRVVADQVGTPTYAHDLAEFILKNALNAQHTGVKTYHFTNEGVCSWYDFAQAVMELGGKSCKITPIATAEYPTPAARPSYSVLDKTTLKKDFKVEIPYWRDSLKDCIERLKNI